MSNFLLYNWKKLNRSYFLSNFQQKRRMEDYYELKLSLPKS